MERQRDSLLSVVAGRDSVAEEMTNYLETLASSLDSIKTAENIYTLTTDESGKALSRSDIRNNLR